MAFNLVWKVEFGDIGGLFDITSFVFDGSVDMNANIGSAGRTSCQITLNNNGGQFTPGGSGTYGSVNWFKQAIIVSCTGGGLTEYAFVGLLQDFDIDQQSTKESTVTITAIDFLSVAGRSSNQLTESGGAHIMRLDQFVESFFNSGYSYAQQSASPTMGSTSSKNSNIDGTMVTTTDTALISSELLTGTLGDWLNNQGLPTAPGTCYMTDYTITSDRWFWNCDAVDSSLNRTTRAYTTTFVDGSTALASGEIAFNKIDVGFQLDSLSNQCYANPSNPVSATLQPVTATNTASQSNYGVRARSYATCIPYTANVVGGVVVVYNNRMMETVANFWANRYGDVRYIPSRVVTAYSTLRKYSVDDGVAMQAFMRLLSAKTALWNRQAVTYKGSGMSSSQTTQTVTTGRKIMITPSDTRVELTVVSGIDNQSFELDSSTYGILDTNRLA
jgi:hypothetical protein